MKIECSHCGNHFEGDSDLEQCPKCEQIVSVNRGCTAKHVTPPKISQASAFKAKALCVFGLILCLVGVPCIGFYGLGILVIFCGAYLIRAGAATLDGN
jgi:hypothetical protein